MFYHCYSSILRVVLLFEFALTIRIHTVHAHPGVISGRNRLSPNAINITSLNDRFSGLSLNYSRVSPGQRFTTNQIALSFINAIKRQAIQDCNQYITHYDNSGQEYEGDPVRLQLDSNPEAPQARLTRCNVIYALKVMAVNLLGILYPPEVHFHEWYHDQLLLYFGQLQKIAPQFLVRTSSSTANLSHIVKQEKRALTMSTGTSRGTHTRNATTIVLDLPEYPDTEIRFNFSGERFLKFDLFVSILDFMMDLAQEDSSDSLEYTHSSSPNSPLWIFVAHNRNTGISLAYFEVLAILESIARWAVLQQIYREVFFRFIVNREEVATGCVTKPLLSKAWCQGFGRDGQALLREKVNTVSSK